MDFKSDIKKIAIRLKNDRAERFTSERSDDIHYLISALVEERTEKIWCIENPYPNYSWNEAPEKKVLYARAIKELELEGLWLVGDFTERKIRHED